MEIRTYRARTMHEALALVQRDLGPDAAVLHTREVRRSRWFGLWQGAPEIEVTASAGVQVPSRLPEQRCPAVPAEPSGPPAPATRQLEGQLNRLHAMVEQLCRQSARAEEELPEVFFRLFTDLIEADLDEEEARQLVHRVRSEAAGAELADPLLLKARVARLVESEIRVTGPIQVVADTCRLAALVGPTGVGKTTTIAKLAAHYRLREKRNVGLITVDTYRIAAVEQLRTYADIIDLPMQVVSSPREMRDAVRRMQGLDLILMDTAGRSPRDEIRIQELKAFLNEAGADEVHLVLSAVSGTRALQQTAEKFAAVGTTSLILTKLDEATGLGHILPLIRSSGLPVSYLTNGQNVPDDIETAEAGRLARLILAMEQAT